MILTLAFRNLFHDRVRLVVTLVGIMFSVVLVAVQLGLYLGAANLIANTIDNTKADLWIMPRGTRSIIDVSLLSGREKHAALSTPGVVDATELIVTFSEWRAGDTKPTPVTLLGIEPGTWGMQPWNIQEGSTLSLRDPNAVSVDDVYANLLGIAKVGEIGQIAGQKARITQVTHGIRSFATQPFVFASLRQVRDYTGIPQHISNFVLLRVADGLDHEKVAKSIADKLSGAEVLTTLQFRTRTVDQYLNGTGTGQALIIGSVLGLIVGTVIVAQTLYASTKEHIVEFGTLRALGSTTSYIMRVILSQAVISAIFGYLFAMLVTMAVVMVSADSELPIILTPWLAVSLFWLTVGMCVVSAISAIFQVTRIDPAEVFGR
jgi:putative ABC transport system permease protein